MPNRRAGAPVGGAVGDTVSPWEAPGAPGQRAATTGRLPERAAAGGAAPSGVRVVRVSGRAASSERVRCGVVAECAAELVTVRGRAPAEPAGRVRAVPGVPAVPAVTALATTTGPEAAECWGLCLRELGASARGLPEVGPSARDPSTRDPPEPGPPALAPPGAAAGRRSFPAAPSVATGATAGGGVTSGVAGPFAWSAGTALVVPPVVEWSARLRWTSAVPSSGASAPGARGAAPVGGTGAVAELWPGRTGARWTSGPGVVVRDARGAAEPGSSALGGSAGSGAPRPPRARAPVLPGPGAGAGVRRGASAWAAGAVLFVAPVPLVPLVAPVPLVPPVPLSFAPEVSAWRWTTGSVGPGADPVPDAGVLCVNGVAVEGSSLSGAPRGARLRAGVAVRCTGAVEPVVVLAGVVVAEASGVGAVSGAGGLAGRTAAIRRAGPAGRRATVRRGPDGLSRTAGWDPSAPEVRDASGCGPVASVTARWTAGPEDVRPPEAVQVADVRPEFAPEAGRGAAPPGAAGGTTTATRRTSGVLGTTGCWWPVSAGATAGLAPGSTARWTEAGDEERTAGNPRT